MHKKIKIILSVWAALITVNDNLCYFIIFSRGVEVATFTMLVCCLLVAEWHMCVLCTPTVYFVGGQLVFNWDRLENFLVTRYRPVGNKVTNANCQSWVSYVQNILATIAFVSDAQTEGKVFVSHKSWLPRNNRKNISQYLRSICRASPWSANPRCTKEYAWPTNWWIIFVCFLEYWFKNVLLRCRQFNAKWGAIDQVTLGDRPLNAIDLSATLIYFRV